MFLVHPTITPEQMAASPPADPLPHRYAATPAHTRTASGLRHSYPDHGSGKLAPAPPGSCSPAHLDHHRFRSHRPRHPARPHRPGRSWHPDPARPTAYSQPQRAPQAPHWRPAPHPLAGLRQHRRLACARDRCPQAGGLWGVGLRPCEGRSGVVPAAGCEGSAGLSVLGCRRPRFLSRQDSLAAATAPSLPR